MTSSQSVQPNRPLSPHLQVYKPQLTSVLSISHRLTGLWLGLTAAVLILIVWATANGPEAHERATFWIDSWLGVVFFGFSLLCFYYHLCNGIRHLFWDFGKGFEIKHVYRSGWLVVLAALALTILTWCVAPMCWSAG